MPESNQLEQYFIQKLGLAWEDKIETIAEECKEKLPLLEEIKSKAINTNLNHPTNFLIEGDNYHALSVLNYTHAGKIDVIYIDPPYNSGSRDWKYNNNYVDKKDAYRHSKWLSFMDKRLRLAKNLLKENGVLICAIDYREQCRLGLLLEDIFPNKEQVCITIVHNPRGKQGANFSYNHEYAFFILPNKKIINKKSLESVAISNFRNWGGESLRSDGKNCFYPIYVKQENNKFIIQKIGEVSKDSYHPQKQTIEKNGLFAVYPVDLGDKERKWRYSDTGIKRVIGDLVVKKHSEERLEIFLKKTEIPYKTVWNNKKHDAGGLYGKRLLSNIFKGTKDFDYPKSLYTVKECLIASCKNNQDAIVLDFFAGSGTTGHAVLEMNKEDNGNRQFILCTNNENKICEEITYERIKRVIKGYKFQGEKKEILLKEKLNMTTLKKIKNNDKEDILDRIESIKEEKQSSYDEIKSEITEKHLSLIGIKNIQNKTEGLGGNLRYFKTKFISGKANKPLDSTKAQLMKSAVDVLRFKEDAFETKIDRKDYKIFKGYKIYVGILFKIDQIFQFKEEIEKICKTDKEINVYIFSFSGEESLGNHFNRYKRIKVVPVPQAILKVYKRIFYKK